MLTSTKHLFQIRIHYFVNITNSQILNYISSITEPKRSEMEELHRIILDLKPECRLWFLDGKNEEEKQVTNPDIGYGFYNIKYADGSTREFYRIGLSANKTGISVYILGLADKKYLSETYGEKIGKATVTGYCIKFKSIKVINLDVLSEAVKFGFEYE